jgi:thiamine pyrophosphokinase
MRAVIVASGDVAHDDVRHLDGAALVVAADGGAASLDALGRRPHLLVGDLDSVDPGLVQRLEADGIRVERHPVDKEASDTELAVGAAAEAGATEIVVLGALGGARVDHALANVLLLADPDFADRDIRIVNGATTIRVVTGGRRLELAGSVGDLVTLLPVGGPAHGVTTTGLRWALNGASLAMGRSRGLSNEVSSIPASVSVGDGSLLVIETTIERSTS